MIRVRLEGQTNTEFTVSRADVARRDPAGETVIGGMLARWSGDDAGDKTIDLNPGAALDDKWDEAVAPAIKAWYEHVDGALELPGAELELEYVLCAFAFFGLRVDPSSVVLADAPPAAKYRAKLYIKSMENIPKAVAFILSKFDEDPSLEKKYVEYVRSDSLGDMIAEHGTELSYIGVRSLTQNLPQQEAQFGKVEDHKNWMEGEYFRGYAVELLKDAGLEASWKEEYLQTRGPGFEYSQSNEDRIVLNHRQVLTVTLPTAAESVKQHREKRQRTG